MKAAVIVAKCPKTKRSYGIRVEQMEDLDWWRTWSFEIDDTRAAREGYDTNTIEGNLNALDSYPGCPYCGSTTYFFCTCGKISCGGPNGVDYTCPWCGSTCKPVPLTDKITLQNRDDL